MRKPSIVVLTGVSGSGKTTIGILLAQTAHTLFADADDFHSAAGKAKMASGRPLNDLDRKPWLAALNALLQGWLDAGTPGVLACSALKESYRERLAVGIPEGEVRFVLLEASRDLIAARLTERHHEFMNPGLLESQLRTLEASEKSLHVQNDRAPEQVVAQVMSLVNW